MEYWVNFSELGAVGWTVFIAYSLLSIYMIYWGYKRKGAVGLLLALFLNWIGWIIILCLPKDKKDGERERERELILIHLNRVYE